MQDWTVTLTIHAIGEDEEAVRERVQLELSTQSLAFNIESIDAWVKGDNES